MYYQRKLEADITRGIENNPVTAILGPRQCGKSTLARHMAENSGREVVFLDLEKPADLRKVEDAGWFLGTLKDKLVCIDEIQRIPELFPIIRSLVDEWAGNGHFLVLGSASRDLIRQSSESLAGRISYKYLSPFLWEEIDQLVSLEDYLVKGGFPRSILNKDLQTSFEWREDFLSTFLERDLLLWSGFSPVAMRKFWQMLAHLNSQIINFAGLGKALGVSHTTARNYTELLASTFMLRILPPFLTNTGKRLVKSPKVYLSDTGITNCLLGIPGFSQLSGHPSMGSAWEAMVLNNLTACFPRFDFYFYRTGHGAEIDIVIQYGDKIIAVECKASLAPSLEKGTYYAIDDLHPEATFVVSPVSAGWPMKKGISVVNLKEAVTGIAEIFA